MTDRTPAHRSTYREPARIDWRVVAPASRKVLDRVARLGTETVFSTRSLVIAAVSSCAGGAAFTLGMVALLHR